MKRMLIAVMCVCVIGSAASAGIITSGTAAPTGYFASGVPGATSFTRVFADGARLAVSNKTDQNEGRGNEIKADSGSYAGYTMTDLVIRKDADQDFTNSTATLTLYVFEGTKEMFDAGDGQSDGDLWNGTGITNIYMETFAINGSYAEGDYITLVLDNPITMAEQMNWFLKMDQGDSGQAYFQINQKSSDIALSIQDGYQYQATNSNNLFTGSPLEYYAVGAVPEPATMALLGLGSLIAIRRKR